MEEKFDLIENIISKIFFTKDIYKINKIIDKTNLFFVIFYILLGLVTLFYLNTGFLGSYYFGLAFWGFIMIFLILIMKADELPKILIIFLYSHGLTGLFSMLFPPLYSIFCNPLMSDNPINIYIYLFFPLLSIFVAFLWCNLIILFNKFKSIKHIEFYIMFLYTFGFIFIFILPLIFNFIYSFKLF